MPLTNSSDGRGRFYRWGYAGERGKKYYYITRNKKSRELAKQKAMKQARAIEWSKHSKK